MLSWARRAELTGTYCKALLQMAAAVTSPLTTINAGSTLNRLTLLSLPTGR